MIICGDTEVQIRYVQSDRPYLVDVPVKINIWIREECQRKQFEVLKKARPSILFVTSDGGRNEREWEIIRRHRAMFDSEIDWQCTVYSLYMTENTGLYGMGKYRTELIWSTVDRCIMLEDDVIPSVSFFRYCAELLEKYKDDPRISCICGMNHLGVWDEASADYFFSRQGSIWGYATWRRFVMQDRSFHYGKDPYTMKLLRNQLKDNPTFLKKVETYAKEELCDGHIAATEFWLEFDMCARGSLQIIPKKNMICNIGCTEDSAHAKGYKYLNSDAKKLFFMKTYELEGEISHPKYMMPDMDYEKRRNATLGYNDPKAARRHKFETTLLRIKYDGLFRWFFALLSRKLKRSHITHEK